MKQLVLILCLLVALPFAGCHHGKNTASILAEAEALVYEYPDSALQLMESISLPEQLTGKEQADYALLLSLAQYRCYIPTTSDSLISIAVHYYKETDNADKKGMAYYVLGSILQECKEDMKTVIQAYKDAEQQVPHMTDLPTISRIYSRLGFLNQSASNYGQAKQYYKQAINANEKSDDYHSLANNYLNLFRIYYLSDEKDSVDWCSNQLLQLDTILKDSALRSKIHQNIGVRQMYLGNLTTAEEHLTTAFRLDTKNTRIALSLAKIYQSTNRMDKADSLCTSLSTHPDLLVRTNAYRNLLNGLLQQSSSHAVALFNKYTALADSSYLQMYNTKMSELQFQYDRAILEKDNIRLYNRWLLSIGSFILLCTLFCFGAYQFYQCKKKELSDLNNTLSVLEAEKRQLETVNKEMDGYRMTKAEREERLESLNQEIKTLQNKERRLKDAVKRMDAVKEHIYSSSENGHDASFNAYQSLTRQGIYHPSTDRPHLKNFLNQLFYQFADRLSSQYPTLKDRDLDICYMMALQLNPDEMAQIFNISTDSIKRYIRKITKEMQSISQDSMSLEERINLFKRRY